MEFDLQPTLRGKLIELRPLTPADYEPLYQAASDPLIWEQHPESDRWKREIFQRYFDTGVQSGGALVAIDRATGRIIGCSRYHNLNPAASEIEIGWTFLERAYWGGDYNGEMKSLMLQHAFRFVKNVIFVVGAHNLRSQKAVQKIGGRFRENTVRLSRDGNPMPNVIFVISR